MMTLNWADYFIIGLITLSGVMSFARGFVKEAISLASWVAAIVVGIKFSPILADLLQNTLHTPSVRTIVAFLALFFAVLLLGGLINFLVTQVVTKTGLSGTNRLIGSVFGLVRGVLLVGVLILLARHTALPKDPWWNESHFIAKFEPIADTIGKLLPEKIHKMSHLLLE